MKFYIDDRKENEMKIYLKQENDNIVHIMGIDHTGRSWTLFSLLPDGTFRRVGNINKGLGIQTGLHGKIKESKN